MTSTEVVSSAVYELPLGDAGSVSVSAVPGRSPLPESLLLKNVRWFCRLRWVVIAILASFGALGLVPDLLGTVGLRPSVGWPMVAAGILTLGNIMFCGLPRLLRRTSTPRHARLNLWGQIVFDLLILTGVVHFVGSLQTSIAFAYLFHIVLACIFLSRGESLAVTLTACVLYTGCVAAEAAGLLAPHTVFAAAPGRDYVGPAPWGALWDMALAIAIWLSVWHLTSHLAAMVRARDEQLAEANRRLEAAIEERSRHMLRTTHELKAPFAAIHASAQVLLDGQCGTLPEEALDFLRRISTRCRRLANEIQEMVQLANLRSESQGAMPKVGLNVADLLRWSLAQVLPLAEERRVTFQADIQPARTVGVADHLKMLFSNILGNAVVYSYEGGRVRVRCAPRRDGAAEVAVEDDGIGIPAGKLPHIFEEYYRTDEAVRHNKQSSGLGLAIVRHVAQAHRIRIRVESRPGAGTSFRMTLPPADGAPDTDVQDKEKSDGLPDDR
jgi:signal transduction histidine kinase